MARPPCFVRETPYLCLAAAVLGVVVLHTSNQQWSGDFWEHAAVVRELARRPWNPQHPLFGTAAPHPFFSPYTLAAGLVSRTTGLSAVNVLAIFGIINVLALLVSLRLLAGCFGQPRAAVYLLLFSLLLWGRDPWRYSGFIHANALGFVAAYPSIAAFWLTCVCLWAWMRFVQSFERRWLALVALGLPIVLITHPISGLALTVGLIALSVPVALASPRRVLFAWGGLGALSGALVLLWPLYPWFELVETGSDVYAKPNLAMYEGVLQRTWPLVLALPLAVRRWRSQPFDPLVCFVVAMSAMYCAGAVLQNGPLGRVLPFLALGLHMTIAAALASLETTDLRVRRWRWAAVVLVVGAGLINLAPGLVRAVPRPLLPVNMASDPRLARVTEVYTWLREQIGPDDVVMADLNFSRYAPAFTGKVVGFVDPEAFVPDEVERRDVVGRFFGPATVDERRRLLARYNVRFIAVDARQEALSPTLRLDLAALGAVKRDDGSFLIVEHQSR